MYLCIYLSICLSFVLSFVLSFFISLSTSTYMDCGIANIFLNLWLSPFKVVIYLSIHLIYPCIHLPDLSMYPLTSFIYVSTYLVLSMYPLIWFYLCIRLPHLSTYALTWFYLCLILFMYPLTWFSLCIHHFILYMCLAIYLLFLFICLSSSGTHVHCLFWQT